MNTLKLKKPETMPKKTTSLVSSKLINLINYRIQQEELSSRLYLAMSLWLNDNGYFGAAKLWKKYSTEELVHADWARSFLLDLGLRPETQPLENVQNIFSSLPEIVRLSYDHEVLIYEQCTELAKAALAEGNMLLYPLAIKYTGEQVEELGKLQNHLDRLSAFGTEPMLLRELDEEMGELAEG